MSPCLVQQLFRQKIGKELDQDLIDEFFFPMLRSRNEYPRELLLDIRLSQMVQLEWMRASVIPTFTPVPAYWLHPKTLPNGQPDLAYGVPYHPWGKRTSKVRRRIRRSNWGTIDILNALRDLNYPLIGYRGARQRRQLVLRHGKLSPEFDDAYIRLNEDNSLPPISWLTALHNKVVIKERVQFVNDFLEDKLNTGKRLTWNGSVLR